MHLKPIWAVLFLWGRAASSRTGVSYQSIHALGVMSQHDLKILMMVMVKLTQPKQQVQTDSPKWPSWLKPTKLKENDFFSRIDMLPNWYNLEKIINEAKWLVELCLSDPLGMKVGCKILIFDLLICLQFSALYNTVPPEKPYQASKSNTFFMVILLIAYFMICIPVGYVLVR